MKMTFRIINGLLRCKESTQRFLLNFVNLLAKDLQSICRPAPGLSLKRASRTLSDLKSNLPCTSSQIFWGVPYGDSGIWGWY